MNEVEGAAEMLRWLDEIHDKLVIAENAERIQKIIDWVRKRIETEAAPVVAPNVMGSADQDAASEFTANDIDGAYFMGVFNSTGIDGTIKELQRFKELGTLPHLTIGLLKRAATKDGIVP